MKKSVLFLVISMIFVACTKEKTNILIIGDSISIGYTPYVQENLQNVATVIHNEGNAQHTRNGLEKIHDWLGDEEWDIIQFNLGLWDLCYRHPDSKVQGNRDKTNGTITNPVDVYSKNLDSLVTILEATRAQLVFVTISYVPKEEAGRYTDDAIKYNKAALEVMKKHKVKVNDIYEQTILIHAKHGKGEDDVHYTEEGYKEIGKIISSFLEELL